MADPEAEFKRHPLFFAGGTWEKQAPWNDREGWSAAIADVPPEEELAAECNDDAWGTKRTMSILIEVLAPAAHALRTHTPDRRLQALDAGCGLGPAAYLVASLGCDVLALDFAEGMITARNLLHTTRAERFLRASQRGAPHDGYPACGTVTSRVGDWHDNDLPRMSFDIVFALGSLRLSRKAYWRSSLARFRELLTPSGLLVTLNHNARAVQGEVNELATDAGFRLGQSWSDVEPGLESGIPAFVGLWPTG